MRRRSGFTMLEMLVAIAIASVVVVGLYGLFTVQSRQFLFQDLQMEMHQNLRFGTDVLSRSVRMAGFSTSGFVAGVMGYDGTSGSSVDAEELPAIISWDSDGTNGTDAITVIYGEPSTVMSTDWSVTESCDATTIQFQPNLIDNNAKLQQLEAGDLLLCHDYASMSGPESYLWSLSADANAATGEVDVSSNSGVGYTDYDNICPASENLSPIMRCARAQVLTFYIDDEADEFGPGSEDSPVLMMDLNYNWPNNDDVPLVDNVEELQLEYCMDDPAGVATCNTPEQWKDSFTSDRADEVVAVRIHLVIRSSREDPRDLYKSTPFSLANKTASSDQDGYYRQVLTTEVTVRNIRML